LEGRGGYEGLTLGPPRARSRITRPFTMNDYEAFLVCWENAGDSVSLRLLDRREEVKKSLSCDPNLFLVAEDNGSVVDVIMGAWDGRRGWLYYLAVGVNSQHQGVATDLISTIEKRLVAKSCLKINLLVSQENLAARRLYRWLGCKKVVPILPMVKEL